MTASLVSIKSALITKLKATVGVVALLKDPLEVRELEWQGTNFSYPNVRVRVNNFERQTPNSACNIFDVIASIYVFGEDASSLLTDRIADAIFSEMDTKSTTINTTKFLGITAKQFGAMWVEEAGTWRSEVQLKFQVS